MAIKKIVIFGLGGVGNLLAAMLKDIGLQVTAVDKIKNPALSKGIKYVVADAGDAKQLDAIIKGHDAVVSCLPFFLTLNIAKAAHRAGVHYFDPTEDVKTTNAIRKLAKRARKAMVPQCGLAPGIIGIIGAHLAAKFDKNKMLRFIKLRVGALPRHPTGQLGYATNWSVDGLIHEYIADCDVLVSGKRQKIASLRNQEIIRIDGIEYEAFMTSGGLGTMTETYAGKVETLNYKSIRYPGHLAGMKLLLDDLRFRDNPDELVKRIRDNLPPDDEDHVLLHASVQGEINGRLQTQTLAANLNPRTVAGKPRTAILWTTAAAIAAVIELVSKGKLPQKGFVKQETIPLAAFLQTTYGKLYAAECPKLLGL